MDQVAAVVGWIFDNVLNGAVLFSVLLVGMFVVKIYQSGLPPEQVHPDE